jgi:hypothetical protein
VGRLQGRQGQPQGAPRVNWDNYYARSPEEIVPDGVIDWQEMFAPRLSKEERDARCPVGFVIWQASLGHRVSLDEARRRIADGERCPPEAEWGRAR